MVRSLVLPVRLRRLVAFALLAVITASFGAVASAQVIGGTLIGMATDEQGRPLAGVVVTVVDAAATPPASRTDEHGAFRLPLSPGRHVIQLDHGRTSRRVETWLISGETTRLDAVLPAGESARPQDHQYRLQPALAFVLDETLLRDLPLDRADAGAAILELTPGIARGSAFGAAADHGTPRRLDGLDLSDPLDGRAFTSFILPAITGATVRAGAGAHERDGSGAILDVVIRAGGASSRGLIDLVGGAASWSRDALPDDTLAANPRLAQRDRPGRSVRVAGVLGGPLSPHLHLGLAVEHTDDANAGDARAITRMPKAHARLAWSAGPRLANVVAFVDRRTTTGDVPIAVRDTAAPGLENERRAHTLATRADYQAPLRGTLQVSSSIELLRGTRTTEPTSDAPARVDDVTGMVSDSLGLVSHDARTRVIAGGAIDWRTSRLGGHDLRVGVEVERTRITEQASFTGGEFFHDLAGRADSVDVWAGTDRQLTLGRDAVYASDTWTPASRIAIVAGVRAARLHGGAYTATALQPRIGATIALDRAARLVARVGTGIVADSLLATQVDRTVGGETSVVTYQILRDGRRVEIARTAPVVASVADGIRHPQVRELGGGADARLSDAVQIGGTVFVRRFLHAVDTVQPDARWLALTRPGLDGAPVSVYRWLNRSVSSAPTIANVDGFSYLGAANQTLGVASAGRDYTAVVVHAQLRLPRDRGRVVVAVTSARSRGSLDDTYDAGLGRSDRFASPTAALNAGEGPTSLTPDLAITAFGTMRVPRLPLRASAIYQRRTGPRYAAQRTFGASSLDVPFGGDGRTALLEPRGARTLDPIDELSLRLASRRFGTRRPIELYADVYNVLGRHAVLAVETQSPVGLSSGAPLVFETPIAVQAPLRVVAGGRVSF